MSGNHKVVAAHLECVYDDHNKYYRTYIISPKNEDGSSAFLIRNWGRRSAPRGQWMRDVRLGVGARNKAIDLHDEKYTKSYSMVHETEFEIDGHLAELLKKQPNKDLCEADCLAVTAAFEAQWCQDICSITEETSETMLGWISDWKETLSARAPARSLQERLNGRILYHDPDRDVAVARVSAGEIEALNGAFDQVSTAAAKDQDDAEIAMIATRLWAPESSGPYRQLANAVRDARRLFRRN